MANLSTRGSRRRVCVLAAFLTTIVILWNRPNTLDPTKATRRPSDQLGRQQVSTPAIGVPIADQSLEPRPPDRAAPWTLSVSLAAPSRDEFLIRQGAWSASTENRQVVVPSVQRPLLVEPESRLGCALRVEDPSAHVVDDDERHVRVSATLTRLQVVIQDSLGVPIPGAAVQLVPPPHGWPVEIASGVMANRRRGSLITKSSDDGACAFAPLVPSSEFRTDSDAELEGKPDVATHAAGDYFLTVAAEGFRSVDLRPVRIETGGVQTEVVTLRCALEMHVAIDDPYHQNGAYRGTACTSIMGMQVPSTASSFAGREFTHEFVAGSASSATFLVFSQESIGLLDIDLTEIDPALCEIRRELTMSRAEPVLISAIDEQGQPVPGLEVVAEWGTGMLRLAHTVFRTDAQGVAAVPMSREIPLRLRLLPTEDEDGYRYQIPLRLARYQPHPGETLQVACRRGHGRWTVAQYER